MGTFVGIIAVVLLFACLVLSGGGCSRQTPPNSPPGVAHGPSRQMLGAMCYEVAPPLRRADYVCPKCGERSLYDENTPSPDQRTKNRVARVVAYEVPSCRREVAEIGRVASNAKVSLDESQFCRKCSPNVTAPKLVLHVSYRGKIRDIEEINHEDLRILREFFAGKLLKEADDDRMMLPLEYRRTRLHELLGVKPDEQ
jgi:hypothetical protein